MIKKDQSNKIALLWTGGKDCCLVLHLLEKQVDYLVTLVPKNFTDDSFKAHKIPLMKEQARKLLLPLVFIEINQPYDQGYNQGFLQLKDQYQVKTVYTGDIEYINYCCNLVETACQTNNLEFIQPLWKKDRFELMALLFKYQIKALITWSDKQEYQDLLVGKIIDEDLIAKMQKLPIDLSGEAGEYHTMVVDCLLFDNKNS
ncbi:MAG: hypothetical protein REH79_03375 [Spiroplasma sp.]|nr:hypothetical protein [Spiroplasma sp.]